MINTENTCCAYAEQRGETEILIPLWRDKYERPMAEIALKGGIQQFEYRALIDCGSSASLVRQDIFDEFVGLLVETKIPKPKSGYCHPVRVSKVTISSPLGGRQQYSTLKVVLPVRFKAKDGDRMVYDHSFYVVKEIPQAMVIGVVMLREYEMGSTFVDGEMNLVLLIHPRQKPWLQAAEDDSGSDENRDRTHATLQRVRFADNKSAEAPRKSSLAKKPTMPTARTAPTANPTADVTKRQIPAAVKPADVQRIVNAAVSQMEERLVKSMADLKAALSSPPVNGVPKGKKSTASADTFANNLARIVRLLTT